MDERNQWCFACGPRNPIGLKLEFREEDDNYLTTFTAGPEHQGYDGIVHGGIISTLLDEIMARYIYAKGFEAVTAKLEIRYRKPTPIGQPLTVGGRITGKLGNIYQLTGQITLPDGTVTAIGKAKVAVIGESAI
ncbi:MAG TPA: PaaI family thioesterase [Methylomusa anaerophila]|uniref:Acyl-coenzyme A thioesterase THEM4 n=1 Tax=Methylomusa anaerophila TaxID=1930071 RepID=A0A348AL27_9FIRM|nr:PaaI family thioesterase [Methylomusa anaerophila]BBB91775.1 thioesterase superfamily protein [Methylomusa anaerophila]HML88488.1 PaaI family thioesterase [Methylomusa anaerophila]